MKGIIHERGFKWYTDMKIVMQPIQDEVVQYNWLISKYECNHYPSEKIAYGNNYVWLSGEELLNIVNQYKIQFIWGVFSAFSKEFKLNDILQYELPSADGYTEFWHNPINMQHPLAIIEIVPWDSTLFLLMSKVDEIVNKIIFSFPESKDLEMYNKAGEIN